MITIDQLLAATEDLKCLALSRHKPSAARIMEETGRRLINNRFTLVVLGEFKRGKSTFINALLGSSLLPTAVIPLTAIPTVLEYGESVSGTVLFKDGSSRVIGPDSLAEYVTERENPNNVKDVKEVRLCLPSAYLKQGIILVDTPGVGSLHQHNTAAAYEYLPQADAGVFVMSVDAPLSSVEVNYLHDIMSFVSNVFFVINKIDLVSKPDLEEVLDFSRHTLANKFSAGDLEIFPLSARQALAGKQNNDQEQVRHSGMDRFEAALADFIRQGKAKLIIEATKNKILRTANELKLELLLWRKCMEDPLEELETKIETFNRELDTLGREREESIYLLYRETDMLGKMVREDIADFQKATLEKLSGELPEFIDSSLGKHSVPETVNMTNAFIATSIESLLTRWRVQERQKVEARFETVAGRFFDRIEAIVDKTIDASTRVFGISVTKHKSGDYIVGDRRFYFQFREDPSIIPELERMKISALLPKNLLRGHLLGKSREKLSELLDRNCGRVRYDLEYGLKEGVREVAGQLRERVDLLADGLKSSLSQARTQRQSGEEEITRAMKKWQREYDTLAGIIKAIEPAQSSEGA